MSPWLGGGGGGSSSSVPSAFQGLSHLTLTTALGDGCHCYPHCTEEKTEAQE